MAFIRSSQCISGIFVLRKLLTFADILPENYRFLQNCYHYISMIEFQFHFNPLFEGTVKVNSHHVAEGRPVDEGERGESGRVDPLPGRGHAQGDHQPQQRLPHHHGGEDPE